MHPAADGSGVIKNTLALEVERAFDLFPFIY
jgi:hypothetical protein